MSAANHSAPAAAGQRPPCSIDAPTSSKATRKSKGNVRPIAPAHGWQNLDLLMRRGLAHARITQGLADGLYQLFSFRLAEAEEELSRLGKASSGDGSAYNRQRNHTADLRTWVGVLGALKENADHAGCSADEAAERVGFAVRRGGAQ